MFFLISYLQHFDKNPFNRSYDFIDTKKTNDIINCKKWTNKEYNAIEIKTILGKHF